MKRLLFVMLAFIALSCGDNTNNRSQSEADDSEESMEGGSLNDEGETVSPDSTNTQSDTDMDHDDDEMESDTTAADGSRRQ